MMLIALWSASAWAQAFLLNDGMTLVQGPLLDTAAGLEAIDPSGAAWEPGAGRLYVVDSEIDEVDGADAPNLFEVDPAKLRVTKRWRLSTSEPTGITWCAGAFFVVDDDTRQLIRYADGRRGDDDWAPDAPPVELREMDPPINNPEGVTCDTGRGQLMVLDVIDAERSIIAEFDPDDLGAPPRRFPLEDTPGKPRGLVYVPDSETLLIVSPGERGAEPSAEPGLRVSAPRTRGGGAVAEFGRSKSGWGLLSSRRLGDTVPPLRRPMGIALRPQAGGVDATLFVLDAGVDNAQDAASRDGRLYTFDLKESTSALSVVISGGISRGDYQAGQVWVLAEYLKKVRRERETFEALYLHPDRLVVTGASAGSVNALLLSIDLTTAGAQPVPEESIYFRTWMPLGLNDEEKSIDFHPEQFYSPDAMIEKTRPLGDTTSPFAPYGALDHEKPYRLNQWGQPLHEGGLISHEWIRGAIAEMERTFEGPASCEDDCYDEIALGVAVDRLTADSDELGATREVIESFGFLVNKHPPDDPPRTIGALTLECPEGLDPCDFDELELSPSGGRAVRPQADDDSAAVVVVKEGQYGEMRFRDVGWHVMPSSGIPLAFPLKTMACEEFLSRSLEPRSVCHHRAGAQDEPLTFIDGGTFDGNPLHLANALARPVDLKGAPVEGAEQIRFILLDPDFSTSRVPAPVRGLATPSERVLSMGRFISTARLQAITQYYRDHGRDRDATLFVPTLSKPLSDNLGAFFGFVDRSFRVFDFYAGVFDMRYSLEERFRDAEAEGRLREGVRADLAPPPVESVAYQAVAELLRRAQRPGPGNWKSDWADPDPAARERVQREIHAAIDEALAPDPALLEDLERAGAAELVDPHGGPLPSDYYFQSPAYPADLMRENLRAIARVAIFQILETAVGGEPYNLDWIIAELSHPVRFDLPEGGVGEPFVFRAYDLGQRENRSRPRLDDLLRARLSWLAGEVTERELALEGFGPNLGMVTLRNMLLGPPAQLTLLSGSPIYPGPLLTVGGEIDWYFRKAPALGVGVRVMRGWFDSSRDEVKGEESSPKGGVYTEGAQALDVRFILVPRMLGRSQQPVLAPLNGWLAVEAGFFVRALWIDGGEGAADSAAPGAPADLGEAYGNPIWWTGQPLVSADHWNAYWALDSRLTLAGLLSFDLQLLGVPELDPLRLPLRGLIGLRLPFSHLDSPFNNAWTQRRWSYTRAFDPNPFVRGIKSTYFYLRLPESAQGRLRGALGVDLGSMWALGAYADWWRSAGLFGDQGPGLIGQEVRDDEHLGSVELGGDLTWRWTGKWLKAAGNTGWRGPFLETGAGVILGSACLHTADADPGACADPADADAVWNLEAPGLGWRTALGYQFRPAFGPGTRWGMLLRMGLGLHGAAMVDAQSPDPRWTPYGIRPQAVIDGGFTLRRRAR